MYQLTYVAVKNCFGFRTTGGKTARALAICRALIGNRSGLPITNSNAKTVRVRGFGVSWPTGSSKSRRDRPRMRMSIRLLFSVLQLNGQKTERVLRECPREKESWRKPPSEQGRIYDDPSFGFFSRVCRLDSTAPTLLRRRSRDCQGINFYLSPNRASRSN